MTSMTSSISLIFLSRFVYECVCVLQCVTKLCTVLCVCGGPRGKEIIICNIQVHTSPSKKYMYCCTALSEPLRSYI